MLQVHPSLACNLTCGHCYSSSGPGARQGVPVDVLTHHVRAAARLGYRVLAVSGGEPLMYPGLADVLRVARDSGMTTAVTTNGTLLRSRRFQEIMDLVDTLAISVDGPEPLHDAIRGPGAFARMVSGLPVLTEGASRFGFIHCLTGASWPHLDWLAEFADSHGASLVQVHPLELEGRAADGMAEMHPEQTALQRAYLATLALSADYPRLSFQFDALLRQQILANPEAVYAGTADVGSAPADLVGVCVIEADGTIVPISFGFGRSYVVGNANTTSLEAAFEDWFGHSGGHSAFRRLCRRVFEDIADDPDDPVVNWHEIVVRRSQEPTLRVH